MMEAPQPHAVLARRIGLGSAIAVVIGSTIGSGIFKSGSSVADRLPGPGPMMLCWIVGGLLALCGALTLAEIGGGRPETGGLYAFIRDTYGRLPAFLFGWSQLVMIRPAAIAAVALAFGEFALKSVNYDPASDGGMLRLWLAAAAVLFVSGLNYVGVKLGTFVTNLTTILKVLGLAIIIILGLAIALPSTGSANFSPAFPAGSFSASAFALAIISVLWAYDGWADLSYLGGEVIDPRKNLPRAIVRGTLLIIGIYLLANIAYLSTLSIHTYRKSPLIAADVAEVLMGPWGVTFVCVTVMISTFGTLNASMLTSPRIFFAMADDRLFFQPVASINQRFGTPGVATWLTCFLSVLLLFVAKKFETLTDIFVTALIPFYALSVASIFWLRKRSDFDPPVRTLGYPVTPILFVLSMLFIFGNALWDNEQRLSTLGVCGGILIGIPIFFLTVGRKLPQA